MKIKRKKRKKIYIHIELSEPLQFWWQLRLASACRFVWLDPVLLDVILFSLGLTDA
jgi:hypothetical protein